MMSDKPTLLTSYKDYHKALRSFIRSGRTSDKASERLLASHEIYPLSSYGFFHYARLEWIDRIAKTKIKSRMKKYMDALQNLDASMSSMIAAFKYSYLRPYGLSSERFPADKNQGETTWYTNGIFVVKNEDPFSDNPDARATIYAVIGVSGWDPMPVPKGRKHVGQDRRSTDIFNDIKGSPYIWLRAVASIKLEDDAVAYFKSKGKDEYLTYSKSGQITLSEEDKVNSYEISSLDGEDAFKVTREPLLNKKGESNFTEIAWKSSTSNEVFSHKYPFNLGRVLSFKGNEAHYDNYIALSSPPSSVWKMVRTSARDTFYTTMKKNLGNNDPFTNKGKEVFGGIYYTKPIPSLDSFTLTSALLLPAGASETTEEAVAGFNDAVFETLPLTVNIHRSEHVLGKDVSVAATKPVQWIAFSSVTPLLSEKIYPSTITPYSSVVVDMIFSPYSSVAMSDKVSGTMGDSNDVKNMNQAVNYYIESTSDAMNQGVNPMKRIPEIGYVDARFYTPDGIDTENLMDVSPKEVSVTGASGKAFIVGKFRSVSVNLVKEHNGTTSEYPICWNPVDVNCIATIPHKETGLSVVSTPSGNKLGLAIICAMVYPIGAGTFLELSNKQGNMLYDSFEPIRSQSQISKKEASSFMYFSYEADAPGWTKCVESLTLDANKRLRVNNSVVKSSKILEDGAGSLSNAFKKNQLSGFGTSSADSYPMEANMGAILRYFSRIPYVNWNGLTASNVSEKMFHSLDIEYGNVEMFTGKQLVGLVGKSFVTANGQIRALPLFISLVNYCTPLAIVSSVSSHLSKDNISSKEVVSVPSIVPTSSDMSQSISIDALSHVIENELNRIEEAASKSIAPASVTPSIMDALSTSIAPAETVNVESVVQLSVSQTASSNDELVSRLYTEIDTKYNNAKKDDLYIPDTLVDPSSATVTDPKTGNTFKFFKHNIDERNSKILKEQIKKEKFKVGDIADSFSSDDDKNINTFLWGLWREEVVQAEETANGLIKSYEATRNKHDLNLAIQWAGVAAARKEYFQTEYGHPVDMHVLQSHVLDALRAKKTRVSKISKAPETDLQTRVVDTYSDVVFFPIWNEKDKGKWSRNARAGSIATHFVNRIRKLYGLTSKPKKGSDDENYSILMNNVILSHDDHITHVKTQALAFADICKRVSQDVFSEGENAYSDIDKALSSIPSGNLPRLEALTPESVSSETAGSQVNPASSFVVVRHARGTGEYQLQDATGQSPLVFDLNGGDFDPQASRVPVIDSVLSSSVNKLLEDVGEIYANDATSILDTERFETLIMTTPGSKLFDPLFEGGEVITPSVTVVTPRASPKTITPTTVPTPSTQLTQEQNEILDRLDSLDSKKISTNNNDTIKSVTNVIHRINRFTARAAQTIEEAKVQNLYQDHNRLIESVEKKLRRLKNRGEELKKRLARLYEIEPWKEEADKIITDYRGMAKPEVKLGLYVPTYTQLWKGAELKIIRETQKYKSVYSDLSSILSSILSIRYNLSKENPQLSESELSKRMGSLINSIISSAITDFKALSKSDVSDIMLKENGVYNTLIKAMSLLGEADKTTKKLQRKDPLNILYLEMRDLVDALKTVRRNYEAYIQGQTVSTAVPRHARPESADVGKSGTKVALYKRTEGVHMTKEEVMRASFSKRSKKISGKIEFVHKDNSAKTTIAFKNLDERISRRNFLSRKGIMKYFYPLYYLGGSLGLGPSRYIVKAKTKYHTISKGKGNVGIPKNGTLKVTIGSVGTLDLAYDFNQIGIPERSSYVVYQKKPFSILLTKPGVFFGILINTSEGVNSRMWSDHIKINSIAIVIQ